MLDPEERMFANALLLLPRSTVSLTLMMKVFGSGLSLVKKMKIAEIGVKCANCAFMILKRFAVLFQQQIEPGG
jgi:hypothetical protein